MFSSHNMSPSGVRYILKRLGATTEPWGTPVFIGRGFDEDVCTTTDCCLCSSKTWANSLLCHVVQMFWYNYVVTSYDQGCRAVLSSQLQPER